MSMQNVAYMSFFWDKFLECTQFNVNNMIVYIGSMAWIVFHYVQIEKC